MFRLSIAGVAGGGSAGASCSFLQFGAGTDSHGAAYISEDVSCSYANATLQVQLALDMPLQFASFLLA